MVHSEIERIRDLLIEAIGRSASVWGVNQTLGRLYALLYMEEEPQSLDQMAQKLVVSKATVSINIRILESFKCVNKVWRKGSRKDFYVAERDFETIFQELIRTNGQAELEIQKKAITEAVVGLEALVRKEPAEDVVGQAKRDLEKVYELARWVQVGEDWMNFFMENNLSDQPQTSVQRIEVEWGDEE